MGPAWGSVGNAIEASFVGTQPGTFGGQGNDRLQSQQYDPQQLLQIISDPFLAPEQKQYAQMLLQQQMQANQPMSPQDRLAMENQQLQNERLRMQMAEFGQPDPTDDIREYQFAVSQGYEGTFQDFMMDMRRAGAPSVNVTNAQGMPVEPLGTDGQILVPDPDSPVGYRVEVAPGSKLAEQRSNREADQAQAGQAALEAEQTRGSIVTSTTQRMRDMLDDKGLLPKVGVIGARLTGWNQEAADMGGMLDTLKGMVVFDRLEKLRQASANGSSGLGQVTEREIALLGAQLGALEQNLSEGLIRETLDTIDDVFTKLSPAAQAYLMGQGGDEFVPGAPTGGGDIFSSREAFISDPGVQEMARQYGVTPEEMWEQGAQ
jgi:hypothetical protein